MKTRIAVALMAVGALVAGPLALPGGAAKSVTVATDDEGDWGAASALSGTPATEIGARSGQDLVEAQISMADKTTLNFVIKVTELPAIGGTPEAVRYIWSLQVDGEYAELDGKYTNYSRGACDPTAGTCPPPRDPGMQPFLVRGNCTTDATANLTTCEELGIVQATFDPAEGTVTIPVTLEMLQAKPGSRIEGGSSSFTSQAGGQILAIPSAFVSRSDMPSDGMNMTKTFTVPGGKAKGKKKKK
jgi:hypothetical protein